MSSGKGGYGGEAGPAEPTASSEQQEAEQQLRGMAEMLAAIGEGMEESSSRGSIMAIAAEVISYADKVRDAASAEEAAAIAKEAQGKKAKWIELIDLLALSKEVEGEEDKQLMMAEAKLRQVASELRSVADRGSSAAFESIGAIAEQAESALKKFQDATTTEEKWEAFAEATESRSQWALQMNQLKSGMVDDDEVEGYTKKKDATEVRDAMATGFVMSVAGAEAAAAPSVPVPARAAAPDGEEAPAQPQLPEDVRKQVITYLTEEEGLLNTMRAAVIKIKDDARFEVIHEECDKMQEQMELAVGAIIPVRTEGLPEDVQPAAFTADLEGAEDRLKAQFEPMRRAQWGAFYAKKAAWSVRKYDTYKRKGEMPKLAEEHPDLMEVAVAITQLAEYLRQEAQGAVMDSITTLVAVTQSDEVV